MSLDGSTAEIHDAFRRVPGSYKWTLRAIRWARELGLPVQVNTTITRRNMADFDAMVRRLESFDIAMWSVFFLVPTGRGQLDDLVSAEEFEAVFAKLYQVARRVPFDIKTTEAQHYRRYVLQMRGGQAIHGFGSADVLTTQRRNHACKLPNFASCGHDWRSITLRSHPDSVLQPRPLTMGFRLRL